MRKYAGQLTFRVLQSQVHADHHRHGARCHAEVDAQRCAGLQPHLEQHQTLGRQPDSDPAAATDRQHGEPERRLLGAEEEPDGDGFTEERDPAVRAERDVLQREDADRDAGQRQVEPRGRPTGVMSTNGGSENPSKGMTRRSLSMKPRMPRNSMPANCTSTSGLAPVTVRKRDAVELHCHQRLARQQLQFEVPQLRADVGLRFAVLARPDLDRDRQVLAVVTVQVEDVPVRGRPALDRRIPVVVNRAVLDGRTQRTQQLVDVARGGRGGIHDVQQRLL